MFLKETLTYKRFSQGTPLYSKCSSLIRYNATITRFDYKTGYDVFIMINMVPFKMRLDIYHINIVLPHCYPW